MFVKFSPKQMGGILLLVIILFVSLAISNMYNISALPSNLEGYTENDDNIEYMNDKEKMKKILEHLVDTKIRERHYTRGLKEDKGRIQRLLDNVGYKDDNTIQINDLLDKLIENKMTTASIFNKIIIKLDRFISSKAHYMESMNILEHLVDTKINKSYYTIGLTENKGRIQRLLDNVGNTDDTIQINDLLDKLIENKMKTASIYKKISIKLDNIDLAGNVITGNTIVPN